MKKSLYVFTILLALFLWATDNLRQRNSPGCRKKDLHSMIGLLKPPGLVLSVVHDGKVIFMARLGSGRGKWKTEQ